MRSEEEIRLKLKDCEHIRDKIIELFGVVPREALFGYIAALKWVLGES